MIAKNVDRRALRFEAVIAVVAASTAAAYFLFGHRLYASLAQSGWSGPVAGALRATLFPAGYDFRKLDVRFMKILAFGLVAANVLYALFRLRSGIASAVKGAFLDRGGLGALRGAPLGARASALPGIALFLFFLGFYSVFSFVLAGTGAFSLYDILFEIDTPRAIGDMTIASANHYRTSVHPLFVLFTNPVGSMLAAALGSSQYAAILLNAVFGSCSVLVAYSFFMLYCGDRANSLLMAGIFGFSMSQFLFSVVPDTASLAILSLTLNYSLFLASLRGRRVPLLLWAAAGLLAFGVTITNFAQALICFCIAALAAPAEDREGSPPAARILAYLILTAAAAAVLMAVQKLLYPSTGLSFDPNTYRTEIGTWASLRIFSEPLLIAYRIAKHFLAVNIFAPFPGLVAYPGRSLPGVTFVDSWDYQAIGWIGAAAALLAIALGAYRAAKRREDAPFFLGAALCILFNAALHAVYGTVDRIEVFTYTGNFTFLVLTFLGYHASSRKSSTRAFYALLAALLSVNNALVMLGIIRLYG